MSISKMTPNVTNREKNEYIPAFITKKPFWVPDETSETDYLEHQRLKKAEEDSRWYDRGKRTGPAATKFRKGACENCGAMTHKSKECLSRPRAKGARWTGKDIQADEVIQEVQLGYDAKRDRWNGYDASEYSSVVREYNEMEKLRKQAAAAAHAAAKDERGEGEPNEDAEQEGDEVEEARYAEESDMGRQQSTATRNLRLREDTAKYLLNLDPDSAKYDPKTRSFMSKGATADAAAALMDEDNFMSASGDVAEFERAQTFAWETQERSGNSHIHIQANPTSGAHSWKKNLEEQEAKHEAKRKLLLEQYGDQKGMSSSLRKVAVVASESFVEYDESGAIKGEVKAPAKSKYAEDVYKNNHTSVWGSWWENFRWGFACCHSTVKNSYCTGEMGRNALEEEQQKRLGEGLEDAMERGSEKRPLANSVEDDEKAQKKQRAD